MPSYSTPGVYVTEALQSSLTQTTTGPTAAVFFGEAARGPTTPQVINDWSTFKTLYGELDTTYDLGYAVYHYFSNGGRSCYVVRVINAAAAVSTKSVPFFPRGTGQASAGMMTVTAISPGTWGNTLSVETIPGSTGATAIAPASYGTFTLIVRLGGVEVERWVDLSVDPNNNRYVNAVVNNYSRFIKVSSPISAAASGGTTYVAGMITLASGTQGIVLFSDYISTFSQLDVLEGNLLLNAVGKFDPTLIQELVSKAATRGDSFVIIDPNPANITVEDFSGTGANFAGSANAGYCAQYVPRLLMVDPAKTGPGAVRLTYPGGAVAGLMIRTEIERTVAKAPAGYFADIRGALGLEVKFSDAQIGQLYDGLTQINSFKAITGAGVVAYGARTFNRARPDKFISVRRTLNYVKTSVKNLSLQAVFEPNNVNLWNSLNMSLSAFLADFWRAGGLKGQRASDAFFIRCDSTNNTALTIDQGIVNIEVGIALQYPAEFIVINVSQWTGGSNVVESV